MDLALKNKMLDELSNLVNAKRYSEISTDSIKQIIIGIVFRLIINHPENELFRAISYLEKPKSIKKLIYPPIDKAKKNRASKQGEQLFYCSNSKAAALYEINANGGNKIAVGNWIIQDHLYTNTIGFTESYFKNFFIDQYGNSEIKEFKGDPNFLESENLKLLEKIGKLFCQDNFDDNDKYYDLTIAIAHALYGGVIKNNGRQLDGIMYPTIKNNGIDKSLALFPSVITNNAITLDKIEYIEMINTDEYLILDYADSIAPDGSINWIGLNKKYNFSSKNQEYVFISKKGMYNCFDIDGNIINPI